jgi:tetratricopeptide (TPR) repeat protein
MLFERTGELPVLTEAVYVGREAVVATPADHPDRAGCLYDLGVGLGDLFERTGRLSVLIEAVQVGRDAVAASVAAAPTDHPDWAATLNSLGVFLRMLFERTGELPLLTEAVQVGRDAVVATPTDDPNRARRLSNLGPSLQTLFQRTGKLSLLTEAVHVGRDAITVTPTDDPDRHSVLNSLATALTALFQRTGELSVLTEAVHVGRGAVAATPTDHPARAASLNNLAITLRHLFERTGELSVLTDAVDVGRDAVAACPTGHSSRAGYLTSLAGSLARSSERTGRLPALTEAVAAGKDAVAATPTDHPERGMMLSNLGTALMRLFQRTGELSVLTEAVAAGKDAVAATPTDHPLRAWHLNNLAVALGELFERIGELSVLTDAVHVERNAVAAAPADHIDRAKCLSNLGGTLLRLFERTGELSVLTEASEAFTDAAASPVAPMATRISACRRLGGIAMEAGAPEAALAAFEAAVELLPQVAPRALALSDREYGLGRMVGLASEVAAAAVAAGQPERAVELLEQTRGLLLSEAIDDRSDLTELRHAAPALATEFEELRERATAIEDAAPDALLVVEELSSGLADTARETQRRNATQISEQRRRLADQWTALLGRIRATAGFEQFLRPPPISQLQRQAHDGPVVQVYTSQWGASALIMTPDPTHPVQGVSLPDLTEDAAYERVGQLRAACAVADNDFTGREQAQRDVRAVLGWLWDTITGPVLDHLGITGGPGPQPRIWWCPIGILAYLPIHAAGHHTDPSDRRCTVLDRAVSSYAITIRTLEHARSPRTTPRAVQGSAVIVAMPITPGAPQLPGVNDETKALARLLRSPLTLTGTTATYQAVTAALPEHRVAHFACHGLSDGADPAASRLLLHDHVSAPLTVTAVARLHLTDADLAYLSACSTTQTSPALIDEAVHLTAAVHLAGYRQVIGTLWPINDTAAARIATDVYTHLTDAGTHPPRTEHSAYALTEATRSLRDDYPASPTRWAAHLHLGT